MLTDCRPIRACEIFGAGRFLILCEDYLKGFFAEWMVGVLLDLPLDNKRRLEFGNCDHVHPGGLRIEVKATARWQSWKLLDQDGNLRPVPKKPATPLNNLRFNVPMTRAADTDFAGPTYKADIYVFCLHTETDLTRWDALDLTQWEFYFLHQDVLRSLRTKSISLAKLRQLCPPMTASEFRDKMCGICAV